MYGDAGSFPSKRHPIIAPNRKAADSSRSTVSRCWLFASCFRSLRPSFRFHLRMGLPFFLLDLCACFPSSPARHPPARSISRIPKNCPWSPSTPVVLKQMTSKTAQSRLPTPPQGHGGSSPLLYCDTSAEKGADTGKPCEQNTCHGRRQCTTPDKRSGQQGEEQERNESDGTP